MQLFLVAQQNQS
ncbi:hypothetical protein D039_5121A, partial [Vibrio parahaemolyticus EKP-028]